VAQGPPRATAMGGPAGRSPPVKNCPVQASGVKEESLACTWTSARVYLLDFARAPPDTITDSAALLLPEAV
jgi:hypothetical protein